MYCYARFTNSGEQAQRGDECHVTPYKVEKTEALYECTITIDEFRGRLTGAAHKSGTHYEPKALLLLGRALRPKHPPSNNPSPSLPEQPRSHEGRPRTTPPPYHPPRKDPLLSTVLFSCLTLLLPLPQPRQHAEELAKYVDAVLPRRFRELRRTHPTTLCRDLRCLLGFHCARANRLGYLLPGEYATSYCPLKTRPSFGDPSSPRNG